MAKPAKRSRRRQPSASQRKSAVKTRIPLRTIETAISKERLIGTTAVPRPIGAKAANTVIYVHGIGNKALASVLKCQWDTALFGAQVGDRSRMVYWVNREYYPVPLAETCGSGDVVKIEDDEASTAAIMAVTLGQSSDDELTLSHEIAALTEDPARQDFLREIANKMLSERLAPLPGPSTKDVRAKILPLPPFLRRLISRNITRAFLRDVNDFLFVKERRELMEQSLLDRLAAGGGPFVVVSHSQGTMIAYNVLRQLERDKVHVSLFVTMGSPLGMQEVQDSIRQWTGGKLPFPSCVDRWVNVAERLDPVAIDGDISNDYEGRIENTSSWGLNPDSPRHPHSATGYLRTKSVQSAVRETVGTAFQQAITPFMIAKDLVADLEDGYRDDRHEVLIQLTEQGSTRVESKRVAQTATEVQSKIHEIVRIGGGSEQEADIELLKHFMVAKLTRLEVEALRSFFADLNIHGIWRDARKRALITSSTHTVQARPANLGYGAEGANIRWAVLDTGIRASHPHFQKYANVVDQWDCTGRGSPRNYPPGSLMYGKLDGNGHGTHVAGIIAGEYHIADPQGSHITLAGMAPRGLLYGFKVLDDEGNGQDSWIIKALDMISEMNESSGQLAIQGVNLSLGGNFDPSVFGCGHTPLCQELRRLWRQGVVVCLAAGNEGYALLSGSEGEIQANLDISIGDPANLDEAIAVGSVHKTNPHTYGISYFSSRGPTADGRRKPDVVAPGEKILSARHDWSGNSVESLYVEMSGTSMASPHVSGILAAFLSLRREFIGYPDRVKKMLVDGCVDLQRDPYAQGAGLPNLIKMLALN